MSTDSQILEFANFRIRKFKNSQILEFSKMRIALSAEGILPTAYTEQKSPKIFLAGINSWKTRKVLQQFSFNFGWQIFVTKLIRTD